MTALYRSTAGTKEGSGLGTNFVPRNQPPKARTQSDQQVQTSAFDAVGLKVARPSQNPPPPLSPRSTFNAIQQTENSRLRQAEARFQSLSENLESAIKAAREKVARLKSQEGLYSRYQERLATSAQELKTAEVSLEALKASAESKELQAVASYEQASTAYRALLRQHKALSDDAAEALTQSQNVRDELSSAQAKHQALEGQFQDAKLQFEGIKREVERSLEVAQCRLGLENDFDRVAGLLKKLQSLDQAQGKATSAQQKVFKPEKSPSPNFGTQTAQQKTFATQMDESPSFGRMTLPPSQTPFLTDLDVESDDADLDLESDDADLRSSTSKDSP